MEKPPETTPLNPEKVNTEMETRNAGELSLFHLEAMAFKCTETPSSKQTQENLKTCIRNHEKLLSHADNELLINIIKALAKKPERGQRKKSYDIEDRNKLYALFANLLTHVNGQNFTENLKSITTHKSIVKPTESNDDQVIKLVGLIDGKKFGEDFNKALRFTNTNRDKFIDKLKELSPRWQGHVELLRRPTPIK